MGQKEQNCVFIQNWIAWNRTVLQFELGTYANWIIQSGNAFVCYIESFEIELFLTVKLYLRWTEMFEIKLFWQSVYLFLTEVFDLRTV